MISCRRHRETTQLVCFGPVDFSGYDTGWNMTAVTFKRPGTPKYACNSGMDSLVNCIKTDNRIEPVFTAQRYASAVYAVALCMSVGPSVTNRILPERLDIGSQKQRRTIPRDCSIVQPKS